MSLKFLALTSRGLFDVLELELKSLGFQTKKTLEGIYFYSGWEGCYKANLWLRSATRILYPIGQFTAKNNAQLYKNIKKISFTGWISPHQTFKVASDIVKEQKYPIFKDSRFVNLQVKDAIADQFREKYKTRPSVDKKSCDLPIYIRVDGKNIFVALDTSGQSLSKRGYRKSSVTSALREHLAAGLLLMSKWDKKSALIDPMCGSGTFLIEGAMMALNIAPGLLRKSFAFQKWKNFQSSIWQQIVNQAIASEENKKQLPFPICGFDKSASAVKSAKLNALAAQVESFVHFQKKEIDELTLQSIKKVSKMNGLENKNQVSAQAKNLTGLLITNPPYGIRSSFQTTKNTSLDTSSNPSEEVLQKQPSVDSLDCYKALSYIIKSQFQDWTAWILSGRLSSFTQLKASHKYFVKNGQIDCRFLCYKIRSTPLVKTYMDPMYKNTLNR